MTSHLSRGPPFCQPCPRNVDGFVSAAELHPSVPLLNSTRIRYTLLLTSAIPPYDHHVYSNRVYRDQSLGFSYTAPLLGGPSLVGQLASNQLNLRHFCHLITIKKPPERGIERDKRQTFYELIISCRASIGPGTFPLLPISLSSEVDRVSRVFRDQKDSTNQ
jgi:hypothetical protein